MKLRTSEVEQTRAVGEALAGVLRPGDVVVLSGELGTGKTVFAQGIGRGLGVVGPVVSPAFVIVREYEGKLPLTHVDVYRVDRVQELNDIGFEEVLDGSRVTVVEWGERVLPFLPAERLEVRLAQGEGDDDRIIGLSWRGRSWEARSAALAAAVAGLGS